MANRMISFGYGITDGKITIVENEATVIRHIFDSYCSGEMLNSIASELTKKCIDYYEGNCNWNKNRIDRIIENSKYIGEQNYPPIISEKVFFMANNLKNSKGYKKQKQSDEIKILKKIVFCSECGKTLTRIPQWGTREKWICSSGCKIDTYLGDKELFEQLYILVSKINNNPDLLKNVASVPTYSRTTEIIKCNNELTAIMNERNPSFKVGKKIIMKSASLKFSACDYIETECENSIIAEVNKIVANDNYISSEFLSKFVKEIRVLKNGNIVVKFANEKDVNSCS